MIRFAVVSAALLAAGLAGQAHAQAVVEDPGYCAQYYPNANCTNYGPGNPLYPGSFVPSRPPRAYPGPNATIHGPYGVHRHRQHHVYR
jgi:hypothetical protein